ncbi:MAG: protocatechuate 3,4-dioxygenase subunit alpha [Geminicoccaceae bacterium]
MLTETASQTAGPYLHIGMMPHVAGLKIREDERWHILAGEGAAGERIRLEGLVYDGTGTLVRDAMVEIWQANAHGRYQHPTDQQDRPLDPAFRGFGRAVADFKTGLWWFDTVKPGPVPGRHGTAMAPHINVAVFARGINIHLNTRIYFEDEAEANAADPVLRLIEQESRRATLIARRERAQGTTVYHIDIRLQGDNETVFFDV